MRLERLDTPVTRRLQAIVKQRIAEEPVIALHGPRTVGKSTLLHELAGSDGHRVVDLDEPATLQAVLSDPQIFVAENETVFIDEYQRAPILLDAIKAELNRGLRPGRYVITGSTRYQSLPLTAQSLTGRLHVMQVWPLSQGEISGVHETFVERALDDPSELITRDESSTTRNDYVARVLRGGMPLALQRSNDAARARWFDDFVTLVVERDVLDLSRVHQRDALPRLLAQLAAQTSGILTIKKAATLSDLEPTTAENYLKLLEAVFLVYRLPAWGRTLRSRVTKSPKLHVVDSGLAARLLRVTSSKLAAKEPAALVEFGHLLETFVVGEVSKQAGWLDQHTALGHFRTAEGDEVDLVVERDDGAILGIEVKASSSAPSASDLKGLRILRDMLGERFLGGLVLTLGQRSYTAEDRIHVLPVDRLWTA